MGRRDVLREAFDRPREVHAFVHGVYDGMTCRPWKVRAGEHEVPAGGHAEAEPHYYRGGHIFGAVLQLILLLGFAALGVGVV